MVCLLLYSYRQIRYEDLVSDPMAELERLYEFMGVSFGPRERDLVQKHVNATNDGEDKKVGRDWLGVCSISFKNIVCLSVRETRITQKKKTLKPWQLCPDKDTDQDQDK